ncbi:gephyrin-like molybdotransferase Glp [Bailinhaonella thermotolerans]|uniref:Molybdopterin molybdenumtransferase n=1 Tax=Bailinhaonella thermotolerans TaxID=1070861 RepID=A0A3A4BFJ3_9ACTN|nr:gephyrin-like molybdotransferase Glp [Bailinhaonella thermotolerans]RJL33252.1 molybdopterin molybdenumtransferase MoeA [Bailinhaonella thermotolerans]
MRSVDEHLASILAAVRPLAPLELDLMEAHGGVLAEDVTTPVPLPPFDNSAMDGYAVRAADLAGASESAPVTLPVVEDIAAGDGGIRAIAPGHCARIMTGAPLPAGADAVVPVEWTDGGTVRVRIGRAPAEGDAIRRAGEDAPAGTTVLTAGTRLRAPQIGLIAGVGRRRVLVRPRPRVVVMSTGSELVEPGSPTGSGQIWDSNSHTLTSAAVEAGCVGYRHGMVGDDPREFLDQLDAQLVRADAVITSGGVSMGAYEPVKEALAPLGTVTFEKVAMQPGMPQGFGLVGPDSVPIFALPGNPVSSFVSFVVFVLPALRRMQGLPVEPCVLSAVAAAPMRSPAGKRSFLRAVLSRGEHGGFLASPVRAQGSHQLAALASANALVVVPEDVTSVEPGTSVDVLPLSPLP